MGLFEKVNSVLETVALLYLVNISSLLSLDISERCITKRPAPGFLYFDFLSAYVPSVLELDRHSS